MSKRSIIYGLVGEVALAQEPVSETALAGTQLEQPAQIGLFEPAVDAKEEASVPASVQSVPATVPANLAAPASTPPTPNHEYALAHRLYAFRGSVETLRGLGDLYQTIKGRIEKGEVYLRGQIRAPITRQWLEQLLALPFDDERAAGIAVRLRKLQPGAATALDLLMELRAKAAETMRRVEREADMQHEMEKEIAGPGRYICTNCFCIAGPGECSCYETIRRERAALAAGEEPGREGG